MPWKAVSAVSHALPVVEHQTLQVFQMSYKETTISDYTCWLLGIPKRDYNNVYNQGHYILLYIHIYAESSFRHDSFLAYTFFLQNSPGFCIHTLPIASCNPACTKTSSKNAWSGLNQLVYLLNWCGPSGLTILHLGEIEPTRTRWGPPLAHHSRPTYHHHSPYLAARNTSLHDSAVVLNIYPLVI